MTIRTPTSAEQAKNDKIRSLIKQLDLALVLVRGKMREDRLEHSDFHFDNFIHHPVELRIITVIDCELCAIGSPLGDHATLLKPYQIPSHLLAKYPVLETYVLPSPLLGGVSNEKRIVLLLNKAMGIADSTIRKQIQCFYPALALFRLSAISYGVTA